MPDSTTYDPNSTQREDSEFGTKLTYGKLLSSNKKKTPKLLQRMWDGQDPFFDIRFAQWKVNTLRHMGYPNVALTQNDGKFDYYIPPNITPDHVPVVSKLAQINRQLTAILFADPPAPDVKPASWSDDEIYAAQIARRVLEDVEGETMLNDVKQARRAFMKANDYGSGFVYYFVDPKGGGKVPIQIEAHPASDHVTSALNHPETGEPLPPPYVKRYVRKDGSLTGNRSEAAMRDQPVLKSRVLTGRNVRFVPHNAADIWDADGVLIGEFLTWGRLKNLFPKELGNLSEEDQEAIRGYRPNRAEDIAAWGQDLDSGTKNLDERLVWVMTAYFKQTRDYPEGAYVVAVGNKVLIHRGPWKTELEDGTVEVCEIPLTQYAQWGEGRDDPYHVGTSELIGRGEEFRVAQIAAILDHLDRLNNRKIFLDVHTIMNESDLMRKDKKIVRTNGDAPQYEDVPTVPAAVTEWTDRFDVVMDQAIGIGETTSGLESPSVKSGRHALAIVQQAQAALSEPRQNIIQAYERSGRIKLQLIRKYFKNPREAGWTTEDDEFRLDSWSRIDLGHARDVKVRAGSMTMLTPVAKAQLAEHYYAMGMIDQFTMYDIFSNSLGGTLGIEDEPTRLRIRRQISEWKSGPPEGWTPPQPVMQMNPETGMEEPMTPPDPILERIWTPTPADFMPHIAEIRLNEMIKMMSSKTYLQKPAAWRSRVELEFQAMAQAIAPAPAAAPGAEGGATPEQQNLLGSPADQTQANDQSGLTESANSPGQGLPDSESAGTSPVI